VWTILQVRQTLLSAEFGREAVRRSAPIGVRAAKAAPLESIPPSPPKFKRGPVRTPHIRLDESTVANTRSDCRRRVPESCNALPWAFHHTDRSSCDRKLAISVWGSP